MDQHLTYSYERITKDEFDKGILYETTKRIIDILGSLIGLILLSPVFLITAIAIKLDSKGPVFFAHKRLGKNGKIIKMYKFRTMYVGAEDMLNSLSEEQKKEFEKNFKLKDDPRVTKIGDKLRKTSLDELPQLFNILIGNMSIVGPRPIVEREIKKYGPYGKYLLLIKPGLTGLWQVSGRSDVDYDDRVKLDMKYILNRSTWFDIKIIFKTVGVVFHRTGAY